MLVWLLGSFQKSITKKPLPTEGAGDSSSNTLVPSNTNSMLQTTVMNNKCLDIASSTTMSFEGSLILKSIFTHEMLFQDLSSTASNQIGELFPSIAISPDSSKMVGVVENTKELIILDSQARKMNSKLLPTEFGGIIQWVDSESLLIQKFIKLPYG